MPGLALFNCIVSGIGVFVAYKILPETENRSLEEIEMHFSDDSKSITDRKIQHVSKSNKIQNEIKSATINKDDSLGEFEKEITRWFIGFWFIFTNLVIFMLDLATRPQRT